MTNSSTPKMGGNMFLLNIGEFFGTTWCHIPIFFVVVLRTSNPKHVQIYAVDFSRATENKHACANKLRSHWGFILYTSCKGHIKCITVPCQHSQLSSCH